MASPHEDVEAHIHRVLRSYGIDRSDLAIRHLDNDLSLKDTVLPMLRQWLIAKGVDETQVYKASAYVCVAAYVAGDRYVDKMIANNTANQSRRKAPRGFGGLDLDSLLDEKIAKDIGNIETPQAERTPTVTMAPIEKPQAPTDLVASLALGADQIARAAQTVLSKALENYKRETASALSSAAVGIQDRLGAAIDRRWTEAERHFAERTVELVSETKAMVVDLAEKLLPRQIVVKTGPIERTLDSEPRHEAFDRVLRWLLSGEHVYIVGPAGTGKTHMAKQLATAIGKELYLPGQALSKYDISGYKGPTGEYFGTVVRDALENGGLLFVDEGDMWAAAALGFLNAPLANGWCAFPDKTIAVHPNFQCMIAANTYGRGATQEYIGRNPLDAASVDRFAFVTVDYDENLERLLYGNSPWVQYIHRVRAAVRDLKLRHVVSTRAIARVLRGVQAGLSIDDICFSSLWRGLDPGTISKIKSQAGEPPRTLLLIPSEDDLEDEDDLSLTGTDE